MSSHFEPRSSRMESAIAKVTGPFVILVAASTGVLVLLAPSVPPLFVAGTESFLVAVAGIGYLLFRFSRRGVVYARMHELRSGERKLVAALSIPAFVSAGLFAVSRADLDLLVPIEVGVFATGVLLISAGVRRQSGE